MDFNILLHDPEDGATYDITSRTKSITEDKQAKGETNQITLICKNIYERHIWNELEVFDGQGNKLMGGIVINQHDRQQGGIKVTTFTCLDYAYYFLRRLVIKTYLATDFGGRATDIIKDIITNNVEELTANSVQSSNTTIIDGDENLVFPYATVMEAVTDVLQHLRNYSWYVDKDKDFHLYSVSERQGTDLTEDVPFRDTLSVEYLSDTAVNRVWVIGAEKTDTLPIDDYFQGDGTKRLFKISYEPNDPKIYEDGVENTDIDFVENDNGTQDYLVDRFNQVLIVPNGVTPFTGEIRFNYKRTIQVIEQQSNQSSIDTYGLFEKAIKDTDVTTKLNARKIATNMLKDHSIRLRILRFKTDVKYDLGDLVSVNLVDGAWDIQGSFMVKSVTFYAEPSGYVEYSVTLTEVV